MTSKLRILRCVFAGVVLFGSLCVGVGSFAQEQVLKPRLEDEDLVAALRAGGLVILMRHMATDDFVPDDGVIELEACAHQRNLSERGRGEAREVGAAIRKLGIPIGDVLTSPYCRCVETGNLVFGKGTAIDDLAAFDELPAAEKDVRGKLIRSKLNTLPADGRNTVMITHTGTLLYTFGLETQPEGIAHVFRPAEFGNAIYLGSIPPELWSALAESSRSDS